MMRLVPTASRQIGLGLVFVCLAATLAVGLGTKAACTDGDWGDGRQYPRLCYTDIIPLLGTEQLSSGRLPYLDACDANAPGECDEYPVLSMWAMRLTAWASGDDVTRFFYANVALLTIAAFVDHALPVPDGRRARAVLRARADAAVYGFINWDLLPVAFATGATYMYLRRRDVWSGVLLGLGAATKLYPALLVIPFVAGRFRAREPDRGIDLAWAAAGSWVAVNLPFAIASPRSWWEFFRFNSARPADWDSIWFIVCERATGEFSCGHTRDDQRRVGRVVRRARRRRVAMEARARSRVPALDARASRAVLFLLSNKVYSPQYGLWLLPWFALALPNVRLFALFEATDVAVFVTRFSWFGRFSGLGGLPIGAFEIAVALRAVILILCLVAWVRRREPSPEPVPVEPREIAAAGAVA